MASYVLKKPIIPETPSNAPFANVQAQYQNSLLQNQANALANHAIGSNNQTATPNAMNLNAAPYAAPATNNANNAGNANGNGTSSLGAVSGALGNLIGGMATIAHNAAEQQQAQQPEAPDYTADYMAQLSAMLQAQQAYQQQQLAANQAAHAQLVQNAYANNRNNLDTAYGTYMQRLDDTYNKTLGQLDDNYNYTVDQLNRNADNALREAYVNRMLSQKNLAQQLNAQGLTGGASESTMAQLLNNYGNARNSIETQRSDNLTDLLNTYQNNVLSARDKYNSAKNDAEMQNYNYMQRLENDLASGLIGTYDDLYSALNSGYNTYANAMQGLAASQVGNAADLAAANYKARLNAQAKADKDAQSSGGALASAMAANGSGTTGNSFLDEYVNRLRGMSNPKEYLKSLLNNGTITSAEARLIMEAAGLSA